jgi:hypothetical protein
MNTTTRRHRSKSTTENVKKKKEKRNLKRRIEQDALRVEYLNDNDNSCKVFLRTRRVDSLFLNKTISDIDISTHKLNALTHGFSMIVDKNEMKPVLLVKFYPYNTMTEEQQQDFQFIASFLHKFRQFGNPLNNLNASTVKGNMMGVGWRPGANKNISVARYHPNQKTKNNPELFNDWKEKEQHMTAKVAALYRKYFNELSPRLFQQMQVDAKELGVPSLDMLEFDLRFEFKEGDEYFASNLTFMFNDFSNTGHRDNNQNNYDFGF